MRKLGMILGALLMVLGFATEIGAYGERRFAPRKPLPNRVLMRGGLPPVQYYGRPLYGPYRYHRYRRYGPYRPAYVLPNVSVRARGPRLVNRARRGDTVIRVYSVDIVQRGQAYARQFQR